MSVCVGIMCKHSCMCVCVCRCVTGDYLDPAASCSWAEILLQWLFVDWTIRVTSERGGKLSKPSQLQGKGWAMATRWCSHKECGYLHLCFIFWFIDFASEMMCLYDAWILEKTLSLKAQDGVLKCLVLSNIPKYSLYSYKGEKKTIHDSRKMNTLVITWL